MFVVSFLDVSLRARSRIIGIDVSFFFAHKAGPGLVNFGRALVHSEDRLFSTAAWLAAVVVGGLAA